MIAAEKWYQYQQQYNEYGIDMAPKVKKPQVQKKATVILTASDKVKLFLLAIAACAVCIGVIIAVAYAAQIEYNINKMMSDADVVQGEIENLNVAVEKEKNIAVIEDRALNELGMKYPDYDDVVYLRSNNETVEDLAFEIKLQAYK